MLPAAFLDRPIAHRGLHDVRRGVIENSLSAFRAAIEHGYGIELDVQVSSDGDAIVFHDYHLDRLTGENGPVRDRTTAELRKIALSGSTESKVPLEEVLDTVAGRVPVLIEIKDQSLLYGPVDGVLEVGVARALDGYRGPAAVMSFNPHAVKAMADLAPDVPRGLTTERFRRFAVPDAETRRALNKIAEFDAVGASFVSHDVRDLPNPHLARLRDEGYPILCWTVRSRRQEKRARLYTDNVTFEGYLPAASGRAAS